MTTKYFVSHNSCCYCFCSCSYPCCPFSVLFLVPSPLSILSSLHCSRLDHQTWGHSYRPFSPYAPPLFSPQAIRLELVFFHHLLFSIFLYIMSKSTSATWQQNQIKHKEEKEETTRRFPHMPLSPHTNTPTSRQTQIHTPSCCLKVYS